jgi:hypothetical protein
MFLVEQGWFGGSRHQEETITSCGYHHRWLIVIKDIFGGSLFYCGSRDLQEIQLFQKGKRRLPL